ncbi:TPA: hypothetical protein N2D99_002420 [Clostridium botulinum]|nr:hypothetical protein [Clostridium botulinum]
MKCIGRVPEKVYNLEREEIVNYFGYIFEYAFDKNNTKGTTPKEIILNIYLKLSYIKENDRLWCAMTLLTLRYIAEIHQYYYTIAVIDKIIENIEDISIKELEDYMNKINKGIISDGVHALAVRPFEIINICEREVSEYSGYAPYIEQKEKILNIVNKYIDKNSIDLKYINNIMLFDRNASLKYSDIVTQSTEFFISYFKIAYKNIDSDERYKNTSKNKKIESLVTAFYNAILKKNKVKHGFIEDLTNCLVDIVK